MPALKPVLPSYEEAASEAENQGTSNVYRLKVFIELPRIVGKLNLTDYDPGKFVAIIFYGIPLGAYITSTENSSVATTPSTDFKVPDRELVTIVYESPEYDKLVKIRERLFYSGPGSNGILNRSMLTFCSSSLKIFQYDGAKENYFMRISVENVDCFGERELQMASPSEPLYPYTLQVEYTQADLHSKDKRYYVCAPKSPVSTTIMRDQKVVEHERLPSSEGKPAFTVIFKAPNMKDIEKIRSFLTTPQDGDLPEDLELARNVKFGTEYSVREVLQDCGPEKPLNLDFTSYSLVLQTSIYFNCYSCSSRCSCLKYIYA